MSCCYLNLCLISLVYCCYLNFVWFTAKYIHKHCILLVALGWFWFTFEPLSRVYTPRMCIRMCTLEYGDWAHPFIPLSPTAYSACRCIHKLSLSKFKHVELSRLVQTNTGIPANQKGTPSSTYVCVFIFLCMVQPTLCSGNVQTDASADICAHCWCIHMHGIQTRLYNLFHAPILLVLRDFEIFWENNATILWLLMPWLLASPGNQQSWYWLWRIHMSLHS